MPASQSKRLYSISIPAWYNPSVYRHLPSRAADIAEVASANLTLHVHALVILSKCGVALWAVRSLPLGHGVDDELGGRLQRCLFCLALALSFSRVCLLGASQRKRSPLARTDESLQCSKRRWVGSHLDHERRLVASETAAVTAVHQEHWTGQLTDLRRLAAAVLFRNLVCPTSSGRNQRVQWNPTNGSYYT